MPTLKSLEFEWNKIGSWANGNPFTIAFCYPSEGKPFVLKGGYITIKDIVKKSKIPVVTHLTYWHHGESRYIVECFGFPKSVMIHFWKSSHKTIPNHKRRYIRLTIAKRGKQDKVYRLRRIPRCFPEQLREYIVEE